jgi:hypothetical protein
MNTATYCDGLSREFTVRFECEFTGHTVYAAVAGQTSSDPLDAMAMTETEAAVHCGYLVSRAAPGVAGMPGEVVALPEGWSND